MNDRTLPHFVPGIDAFIKDLGSTSTEKQAVASIGDTLAADLASIPSDMIHPAYNTDDLYIYRESTGEIVDVVGSASIRWRGIKDKQETIPSGYGVCNGMSANHERLWHRSDPGTRLICEKRAIELRKAYRSAQRLGQAVAMGVVLS